MLRLILLFILIMALQDQVYAQSTEIIFNLADGTGMPVTDCTIKIWGDKSNLIYGYFNILETSTVKRKIEVQKPDDSLSVLITNMIYADTLLHFPAGQRMDKRQVILKLRNNILKEIKIKGPSVWKQGDTTNFRADNFKQGDEKKLKDLIRNLPGFLITDDGKLLYKNKAVTRILVDGQEIFADKIGLLLNSFPVHVIDLLQAQENQNENKLLKSQGGTETVLNLTLKKGTFTAGFGDIEAGIGTKDRYSANPVVFSLNKYLKAGYVGNINSLGDGLSFNTTQEVRSSADYAADNLLIHGAAISQIPDLPERYYLKNKMFDNRIDISTQVSNRLNIKTTISNVIDKEPQQTYSTEDYFTGTTYTSRQIAKFTRYKPALINIAQVYDYDLDASSNLQVKLSWFEDYGQSSSMTSYHQDSTNTSVNNQLTNSLNSFTGSARYTHLDKDKNASVTTIQYNRQYINQSVKSFSPDWPKIFMLNSSNYTDLLQAPRYKFAVLAIEHKRYFKLGQNKFSGQMTYKNQQMQLDPTLSLSDTTSTLPSFIPQSFNTNGEYNRNILSAGANGDFSIKNPRDLIFQLNVGASRTRIEESTVHQTITLPEINLNLSLVPHFLKSTSSMFGLEFSETATDFTNINNSFLPADATAYHRTAITKDAYKSFSINYNFDVLWKDRVTSTFFYAYYRHQFNNAVYKQNYQNFLSLTTDTLVNKETNDLMFSSTSKIPSLFLQAVLEVESKFSINPYLFADEDKVLQGTNTHTSLKFSFKKNWNKRYYVILSSMYTHIANKRPVLESGEQTDSRYNSFLSTLKQRLVVTKSIGLSFTAKHVYNNSTTSNDTRFLLMDTEMTWKVAKTHLSMTVRAENLTNRKSFVMAFNNLTAQETYTIPLIGRSVFASLRYEL